MNCPMCNRPLKSVKSIAAGIGPVCARKLSELKDTADQDQLKMEIVAEEPPEGQMVIDDYLNEGAKH